MRKKVQEALAQENPRVRVTEDQIKEYYDEMAKQGQSLSSIYGGSATGLDRGSPRALAAKKEEISVQPQDNISGGEFGETAEEEEKAPNQNKKDITSYCLNLCHSVFKSLVSTCERVPFKIRAILKMLVIRSRKLDSQLNHDDQFEKSKLDCRTEGEQHIMLKDSEIFMISELLVGCWLNTGFRNPECFGLNPSIPEQMKS